MQGAGPSAAGFVSEDLRGAAILVLALTGLRLAALAFSPLQLDFEEAQYWLWAQVPAWGYFSKPPLIAWLIAGATALCGHSEFCIRLPSPLMHAGAALLLGAAAGRLAGARAAFWTALAWASLPGVSFSSLLMTTDVPLLLFWAAALYGVVRAAEAGAPGWACFAGVAAGLGFLSKYAMLYFPACAALAWVWAPGLRRRIDWRGAGAFFLPLLLLALPNIAWNLTQGAVTWRHTASLAAPQGGGINWHDLGEYLSGQIGLAGPILPVLMGILLWRPSLLTQPAPDRGGGEGSLPPGDRARLLASFSLPILGLLTLLAVFARGHGNWAATAYPAAVLAVVLGFEGRPTFRWLRWGVGLHLAVAVGGAILIVALALHPSLPGIKLADRLSGWRELGAAIAARLDREPGLRLLTRERALAQLMSYYADGAPDRLRVWNPQGLIGSQIELQSSLIGSDRGSFLLVEPEPAPGDILARFASASPAGEVDAVLPSGAVRRLWLFHLDGFLGYD